MLLLIENHQVGEKKEGEGNEGVVVQVRPQEGKASNLFFVNPKFLGGQSIFSHRYADPKEEGSNKEGELKKTSGPMPTKLVPRLKSHILQSAQTEIAD